MRLSKICLGIGLFSTAVHGVLLVFFVSDLVQLPNLLKKDSDVAITSRWVVALDVFFFVLEIALCIASILLVIGVRKERPRYMAAWIFLTVIFLIGHLMDLMRYSSYIRYHHVDLTVIIKTMPIVLMAAFWYPVFKHWRKIIALKKQKSSEVPSDDSKSQQREQKSTENKSITDKDFESPMLYPNLEGGDNCKPNGTENPPDKKNLYPSLP